MVTTAQTSTLRIQDNPGIDDRTKREQEVQIQIINVECTKQIAEEILPEIIKKGVHLLAKQLGKTLNEMREGRPEVLQRAPSARGPRVIPLTDTRAKKCLADAIEAIAQARVAADDENLKPAFLDSCRWKLKEVWDDKYGNREFRWIVVLLLDVFRNYPSVSLTQGQISAIQSTVALLGDGTLTREDVRLALGTLRGAGLQTLPAWSDEKVSHPVE